MGVVECVKHDLVQPFNVLYEKPGNIHRKLEKSKEDKC